MTILFNVLPLILVATGVTILFWPRQPPPDHAEREDVGKVQRSVSWRRFLLATAFMALAFALALIGQNQSG